MKANKIILPAILLLALLALGCVSAASEDGNLTIADCPDDSNSLEMEAADSNILCGDSADVEFDIPEGNIEYGSDENITLSLPKDAKGSLRIYGDEYENQGNTYYNVDVTSPVVNGKAVIPLKNFTAGRYGLNMEYTGDYKKEVYSYWEYDVETYIQINPFSLPDKIGTDENLTVRFLIPEAANESVRIYDDDTGTFLAGTSLDKTEINLGRFTAKRLYLQFVFTNRFGEMSAHVDILNEARNWEMNIVPFDEVLRGRNQKVTIADVPKGISGKFQLYVDGAEITVDDEDFYEGNSGEELLELRFDASNLSYGRHDLEIRYLGDEYYLPASANVSFNVTNVMVVVRDYDLSNDVNSILIKLPKDATGKITIRANGTKIYDSKISNAEIWDEDFMETVDDVKSWDEDYITVNAEIHNLKYGTYNIEIDVTGKYPFTGHAVLNVTYHMKIPSEIIYGESRIELTCPWDMNGKAYLKIGGKKYYAVIKEYADDGYGGGSYIYVDIPPEILKIGDNPVIIGYEGDKTYPAREISTTLAVRAKILTPYDSEDDGGKVVRDKGGVSLTLPGDASGNLTVEIERYNGKTFEWARSIIAKVHNGKATVLLDDLEFGRYNVYAEYAGSNYNVSCEKFAYHSNPVIKAPSKMVMSSDEYVSIDISDKITGKFTVYDDDFDKSADIKNGTAKIALKKLTAGTHKLYWEIEHVNRFTENGHEFTETDIYSGRVKITVQKATVKASDLTAFYTQAVYKVKIKGADIGLIYGDTVTFKIKNKVIGTAKIDWYGYAKLKIKEGPGKYKITAVYKKSSLTRKLTVKHVISLKSVKITKSAKKLVLTATLKAGKKAIKNKEITFTFNGKKYTAKTNAKGTAKTIVKKSVLKKLKVGQKVTYRAAYLKDSTGRTAKVNP